jgi:hypothetical protein
MAIIYIIQSNLSHISDFYLGVTKNLERRIAFHKKSKATYKLYKFVNDNGGWQNFYFEVLEEVSDDERFQIEKKYIQTLKPSLNIVNTQHPNQYYRRKDNEDYINYQKQYKENNKERLRDAVRRYRAKIRNELIQSCPDTIKKGRPPNNNLTILT